MKFDAYGKTPEGPGKIPGKRWQGEPLRGAKPDDVDDRNWAPSGEDASAMEGARSLAEKLELFKGHVDSILTLRIPGKPEEERIGMVRDALERQRPWAREIDAHCHGEILASDYLEGKLRELDQEGVAAT